MKKFLIFLVAGILLMMPLLGFADHPPQFQTAYVTISELFIGESDNEMYFRVITDNYGAHCDDGPYPSWSFVPFDDPSLKAKMGIALSAYLSGKTVSLLTDSISVTVDGVAGNYCQIKQILVR